MPKDLDTEGLDAFIRDSAVTYWHQCGTAKMGQDDMSVVDASLGVRVSKARRAGDQPQGGASRPAAKSRASAIKA